MARKLVIVLLVVLLAVAVAGLLWAKSAPGKSGQAMMGKNPAQSEYNRCTKTCSVLQDY